MGKRLSPLGKILTCRIGAYEQRALERIAKISGKHGVTISDALRMAIYHTDNTLARVPKARLKTKEKP